MARNRHVIPGPLELNGYEKIEWSLRLKKTFPIYEQLAKQFLEKEAEVLGKDKDSFKNCVKVCLFNAGLCQLFKGDITTTITSLERYQALDPTFENTQECKFLRDLVAAMKRRDVKKFHVLVNEFNINRMKKLNPWETTVLMTVSQKLTTIGNLEQLIASLESIAQQQSHDNGDENTVKDQLLNAGLLQLLLQLYRGDTVAITESLGRYQALDPTFEGTHECKFLRDLADALKGEDYKKLTRVVNAFHNRVALDASKTSILFYFKWFAEGIEKDDPT